MASSVNVLGSRWVLEYCRVGGQLADRAQQTHAYRYLSAGTLKALYVAVVKLADFGLMLFIYIKLFVGSTRESFTSFILQLSRHLCHGRQVVTVNGKLTTSTQS